LPRSHMPEAAPQYVSLTPPKQREAQPMFGYTKPHKRRNPADGKDTPQHGNRAFSSLTVREACCYKAHYCGLCFALSRQYGPLWRACANFDSTLLVLLMSAQWPHDPTFAKVLCPLGSYRKYYVIDGENLFVKIGSALTVAMVDLKSQDALSGTAPAWRGPRSSWADALSPPPERPLPKTRSTCLS
jgi:hypothetical protein